MKNSKLWIVILLALIVVVAVYSVLVSTIKPVAVVVAKQDLNAGTQLTGDLVEVKSLPSGGLPKGTYSSVAEVVGKTLVVARVAGDPITSYVLGDSSTASGIPAMLDPNTVAIAVRVDQATGLGGVLRPGQLVTVIGILDPSEILAGQSLTVASSPVPVLAPTLSAAALSGLPTALPSPTPTSAPPPSAAARITLTGLKVLVVPQSFRYEESVSATGSDSGAFLPAQTNTEQQNNNVVLLEASILPTEIAPGVMASQAETLALLNDKATICLVLDPASGIQPDVKAQGVNLAEIYQAITGLKLQP
ncbi:MAG: Flp pilus assembly protein CpaB [Anaerolineales bacterium]|jgi:Flp pilus assembly protein CpaB